VFMRVPELWKRETLLQLIREVNDLKITIKEPHIPFPLPLLPLSLSCRFPGVEVLDG